VADDPDAARGSIPRGVRTFEEQAMTFRIAQISDTHLSPSKPHFVGNFRAIASKLRRDEPDLVINTGDISLDGADSAEDLAFARDLHVGIALDWLAVPGNHDVGDDPSIAKKQPLDSTRLARYRAHFGDDKFVRDVPGWRLVGINGLLAGADGPESEAQFEFIAEAARGADERRIALFVHKPLLLGKIADPDGTYWRLGNAARARLWAAFGDNRPALVASGHMHQYRRIDDGQTAHVWAPSTGFIVGDGHQERFGTKVVGYVTLELDPDGTFRSRLETVDGLSLDDIAVLPEVYGKIAPVAAA